NIFSRYKLFFQQGLNFIDITEICIKCSAIIARFIRDFFDSNFWQGFDFVYTPKCFDKIILCDFFLTHFRLFFLFSTDFKLLFVDSIQLLYYDYKGLYNTLLPKTIEQYV